MDLKMPECLYDRVFLFLRRLRRPAVLTLWKIIILPLDDPALPFRLRDIQVRHMESVMLLHPSLDLLIGSLTLRRRRIHLVHIDLPADVILCLRKFGQKTYRLHVQRDSEEHNHVGSCCLGIAQSGDMLFGNLSEI